MSNNDSGRSRHSYIPYSEKKACPFCSIVLRYHEGPNIFYCSECGYTLVVEDNKAKEEKEIAASTNDPALNSNKKQNWRDSSNGIFIEPITRPRYKDTRSRHRVSSREVFDKDLDYLNQKPGYVLKDSKEWTEDRRTFSYQSYNDRTRTSRRYH